MHPKRVYIEVNVTFNEIGEMRPNYIKWKDGIIYEIDRVLEIRRATSKAGSMGVRYTVKIMGKERRIFYEDTYSETGTPRWFVERSRGIDIQV